jgi:hypothetical protein
VAPALLFLALVAVVWCDPLFLRRNFGGRDLLGYHLPVESAIHGAWARGRLPTWFAEVSGGRPLAANPNTGALYPVRPLLSFLPFPVAMRIFPVLHWALAGLGAMTLARAAGLSRSAAWIAGVSYAFSGVSVTEAVYTNIQPGLTLLPWVVWAVARPAASLASRVVLLALLLGLDLAAGDVFTAGLAILGAVLWICLEEERPRRFGAVGELAFALVLAALLAAPTLLSAALWAPLTNRAVLGIKVGEAIAMSLSPWRLLELVVPFPFGPTWALEPGVVWGGPVFRGKIIGFFGTIYTGSLAAVGAVLLLRLRDRGARFARAFLALGLALSILPGLVPASWEGLVVPLALRYPEKFAVAVVLALSLGAGLAFQRALERRHSLASLLAIGALLAAAAGAAAYWPEEAGRWAAGAVSAPQPAARVAASHLAPALAEAGLCWMATVLALDWLGAGGQVLRTLALALLAAVPIAVNRRIAPTFGEDALFAPTPFARYVALRDPDGQYRSLGYAMPPEQARPLFGSDPAAIDTDRRVWIYFTPALWGRGQVVQGDVDRGDLSRTESLRQVFFVAALHSDSSVFFGALSLKFGLRARGQPGFSGYRRVGGDALQDWDEHQRPFPDIRLLTRWRECMTATEALAEVPRRGPGEVVLEGTGQSAEGSAPGGTVRAVSRSSERLVLDTESPGPGWLFVLRGWWPYRSVRVDGKDVEAVPAELAFSAVALPAGRHRVEWVEQLPGWEVSRWGPVLSALCALLLGLRRRRARLGAGWVP